MRTFAHIISWLFLPLLAPVYALLIAMYTPAFEAHFLQPNSLFFLNGDQKYAVLYLFIAFSFLAPAITILFLQIRGAISSVMMHARSERVLPAVLVNLFGVTLIVMIHQLIPETLRGYVFISGLAYGSLLTVFFCTLLTGKWKVSLHAAGMGILSGFVFAYYSHMNLFPSWIIPVVFLLSGLVMSMRIVLNAHDLKQSFTGYFIGFVTTTTAISLFF